MDSLTFLLFRSLRRLFTLLPLETNFRLGRLLGALCYYILWPYRRLVLANLGIAFAAEKSPGELRALAKQHFATVGANLLSSLKLATMRFEDIQPRVTMENKDAIMSAREEGRGVIFVNNHSGAWELYAQITPFFPERKYAAVYQRLGNPHIEKAIRDDRARMGVNPFPTSEGFSAPIAFLREGGLASVMVDQHSGDGGVWCPLFNRLASTSPVAATLALRTGARLVPVAIRTTGVARWHIVAGDPIPLHAGTPEALTAEINRRLEGQIRASPADWFWLHNRWKTPSPNFLLSRYKRGVCYPEGYDPAALQPFRILIRSTNWLGDAVMSVPAVNAIKEGRPDARVTILTRDKLADFWKRIPAVDEVISIAANESVFAVANKIAKGKFDVAILFPNSLHSALETWRVPRRAGYPGNRGWLLTESMRPPEQDPHPPRHQAWHYLNLAKFLGADTKGRLPKSNPPGPTAESSSRPVKIGLCPGAEYGPAKRWLPERFAEVAKTVAEKHPCEWILFGTAGDAPVGDEIAAQLGECTNLIGKTTLAELIDRLQECALLLTNDTGTMHLAAFLGVPAVAIFGSTEPILTGPLGGRNIVLRHHVECTPCFLRECPLDFRCMKAIEPPEVTAAIFQLLGWNH